MSPNCPNTSTTDSQDKQAESPKPESSSEMKDNSDGNASAETSSDSSAQPGRIQHIMREPGVHCLPTHNTILQPVMCDVTFPSSVFADVGMPILTQAKKHSSPFMQNASKSKSLIEYIEECNKFFEEMSNYLDLPSHIIKSMPKRYILQELSNEINKAIQVSNL